MPLCGANRHNQLAHKRQVLVDEQAAASSVTRPGCKTAHLHMDWTPGFLQTDSTGSEHLKMKVSGGSKSCYCLYFAIASQPCPWRVSLGFSKTLLITTWRHSPDSPALFGSQTACEDFAMAAQWKLPVAGTSAHCASWQNMNPEWMIGDWGPRHLAYAATSRHGVGRSSAIYQAVMRVAG